MQTLSQILMQMPAHPNCDPIRISDNIWECLSDRRCKFSLCYGGDVFCKHPFVIRAGLAGADEAMR